MNKLYNRIFTHRKKHTASKDISNESGWGTFDFPIKDIPNKQTPIIELKRDQYIVSLAHSYSNESTTENKLYVTIQEVFNGFINERYKEEFIRGVAIRALYPSGELQGVLSYVATVRNVSTTSEIQPVYTFDIAQEFTWYANSDGRVVLTTRHHEDMFITKYHPPVEGEGYPTLIERCWPNEKEFRIIAVLSALSTPDSNVLSLNKAWVISPGVNES